MHWSLMISLLAQGDPPQSSLVALVAPMALIAVVWYFLILRPQGRERREREKLLNALKKNDRVVTHAGIIGTVVNISNDGKEITLRVDDSVKMKFLRSAIQGVVAESTEDTARPGT